MSSLTELSGQHSPERMWQFTADLAMVRVSAPLKLHGHHTSQGLEHIHSHGMVHLDIKPANIFLSEDNTLIIGDFGIAVHVSALRCNNNVALSYVMVCRRTRTQTMMLAIQLTSHLSCWTKTSTMHPSLQFHRYSLSAGWDPRPMCSARA